MWAKYLRCNNQLVIRINNKNKLFIFVIISLEVCYEGATLNNIHIY